MKSRAGKQTKNDFNVFYRGLSTETGGKQFSYLTSKLQENLMLSKKSKEGESNDFTLDANDIAEYIKYQKLQKKSGQDQDEEGAPKNAILETTNDLASNHFRKAMKQNLKIRKEQQEDQKFADQLQSSYRRSKATSGSPRAN